MDVVKCRRCKKSLNINNFQVKSNGNIYKWCSDCIIIRAAKRQTEKCPCGKQFHQCKLCGDAVKITIRLMIMHSKRTDKKYNRYNANNLIDTDFLTGLIESNRFCYYDDCKIEMQYITFTNDLATIERLDNSIGHIQSNCVLCCKSCNCKRKSNNQ
jgi:hypothetical protein